MRFMMLMIPKAYNFVTPDTRPNPEDVARMMEYNQQLAQAGVLLALDGLHPPASGVRVSYAGGKPTVTDGPFAEAKEIVGGYWMIQVKSPAEAIEWARRIPANDGDVVEVRRVFEMDDFSPEIQKNVNETMSDFQSTHAARE